jgi:drug/metabolite transporter (DMT)-like permease
MRLRAELGLIAVTIIWGTTFVLVKSALADISTFVFLALRFALAAAALALIYRRALKRDRIRNALGPGVAAGTLLFTAYAFQTLGLELTTPSKSAFLTGLAIPLVPLASSLVYKNRPRFVEAAGILIASLGMVLMTLPSSLRFEMSRGDILSFLCAVTFALHIVIIGHYSPLIGFESLAVLQIAVAALWGSMLFGFAERMRFHFSVGVAAAVLVTGLLATALAFTTQAWAQQYTSATRAAVIFALEPVVAWFTSWALTGETMANRGKVGAGMILAGILLVEFRRSELVKGRVEQIRIETNPSKGTS